jgi:hypothetical protein
MTMEVSPNLLGGDSSVLFRACGNLDSNGSWHILFPKPLLKKHADCNFLGAGNIY